MNSTPAPNDWITLEDFADYLRSCDETFMTKAAYDCPISCYVRTIVGKGYDVGATTHNVFIGPSDSFSINRSYVLPSWAIEFVKRVDDDGYPCFVENEITPQECLEILGEINV